MSGGKQYTSFDQKSETLRTQFKTCFDSIYIEPVEETETLE